MPITFGGINSGLPPNLVDQLVDAERIPIRTIENRKAKSENRLGLVNELETKLNAITSQIGQLASTRGFNDVKLISGDPNVVQGAVDPAVGAKGSWNIEVVELAQKAAAITNGFPDKDRTEIGVGYFEFETAEGTKEVYIGGKNSTLQGAANAINSARVGVKATVINDRKDPDEPFKLMITGEGMGDEQSISYPTLYFLDGDQDIYFDSKKESKNGIIKVDGFEFEISGHEVDGILPGVTLDIRQASPGRTVNISVKEDREVVSGKIKEFVEAMNGVLGFIQTQNRVDQNTDTSSTLGGDSLLRSVESRLRRLIQNAQMGIKGNIKRLNQIGIHFNRSGTLDFEQDKFNSVLAKNPESVQAFFAGDGFTVGFVPSLKNTLGTVLNQAFGPIQLRKRGLKNKIDRFDQQIESKERALAKKEQTLRRKFAKLEENMSKIKSQGSALAAVGAGGGGLGLNLSGATKS